MNFAFFVVAILTCFNVVSSLDCNLFDKSQIKLVTFDVFAALMDVYTSLERGVGQALPWMDASHVKKIVHEWVGYYGSMEGRAFTMQQTGGAEPFVWMSNSSLQKVLRAHRLTDRVPVNGPVFSELMATWGNEIPWQGSALTLQTLAPHFAIAPLSNGDNETLVRAMSVFSPRPSFIFSSNWPVGAFKPNARMYEQLLFRTQLDPTQILHVAGAPADARGARQAGFFSALTWNQPLPGIQPCFLAPNITHLLSILL